MTTFTYRIPDLENARDNQVICDVFRHSITTQEAAHRRRFTGLKFDASRKVLRRLTDQHFLVQYPLWENKSYWRLGPRAIRRWHFPRKRQDPLGPQRLPYEIGCLALTCLSATHRTRLLPHKLFQLLPWFPENLRQWAYLWENNRLGMIRVEPRCRPDRLVGKLCEHVYRYGALAPEFSELVDDRRFFLAVVCASEEQEHAVQHEAQHQNIDVEIETSHYPELVRFM